MQSMKVICPNGHLGFAPLKPGSFRIGVDAGPDIIAADSGSDDVGPGPLGSDTSTSPLELADAGPGGDAARHRASASVPMIIGSAGDTGTNSRVDLYAEDHPRAGGKHRLAPFKLGWFYSEVDREWLRRKIRSGDAVTGLDARPDLDEAELDATDRIVAMAGVHPFIKLLDMGADVIIGGRSSATAPIFAAPAIRARLPRGAVVLPRQGARMRVVLRRALRRQGDGAGRDHRGRRARSPRCIRTSAARSPPSPGTRCTSAPTPTTSTWPAARSTCAHCRYEQVGPKTTRVTGPRFIPAERVRVKLEGAGKVGERLSASSASATPTPSPTSTR